MSEITDFYSYKKNKFDFSLSDVWKWDDTNLEHVHNYIQYLFPNIEPSYFNRETPKLTKQDIEDLKNNDRFSIRFFMSLSVICRFWGISCYKDTKSNETIFEKSSCFENNSKRWLKQKDHNHLRITRVLNSLMQLGFEKEANNFYKFLMSIVDENPNIINQTSLDYWKDAIENQENKIKFLN